MAAGVTRGRVRKPEPVFDTVVIGGAAALGWVLPVVRGASVALVAALALGAFAVAALVVVAPRATRLPLAFVGLLGGLAAGGLVGGDGGMVAWFFSAVVAGWSAIVALWFVQQRAAGPTGPTGLLLVGAGGCSPRPTSSPPPRRRR